MPRVSVGAVIAVGTTSLRLLESATGEDGMIRPVHRRYVDLHHAGLSVPGDRRADDQFPPAQIDLVHVGLGADGLERMQAVYRHAIEEGYRSL
jgi:S-adenosylmethionine:tRNA ribosyltransferase-isomerase